MKKLTLVLSLLFLFSFNISYADSCYPTGVTFTTQTDIDNFYYYGSEAECYEIGGTVVIEGNDIQNLDGLRILTKIDGDLIIRNCPQLTSVEGLKKLTTIGGKFEIYNNDAMWGFYGLSLLTDIGGDLIIEENSNISTLTGGSIGSLTFAGLSNVSNIGGSIFIENNLLLKDMDGLAGVTSVSGHISIKHNNKLTSISKLSGITTGVVAIRIVDNPLLTSLDGLQNITTTGGGILIQQNPLLTDLSGLDGITDIGWHLYIQQNAKLHNLHGLENLQHIGKDMFINDNPLIENLSGLNNLQTIGANFEISGNDILNSLEALSDLTSINGGLVVTLNPMLSTLKGIDNIDYTTINDLILRSDTQLSTCDVQSICDYLDNNGTASIIGNAVGCNSVEEVQESCSPPACTTITNPEDNEYDVPLDVEIIWDAVDDATGYKISIGTDISPQWDLVNHEDIGNSLSYIYNQDFACDTKIYVLITPYNEHGDQIDCSYIQFYTVGASIELSGAIDEFVCYGDSVQLQAYSDAESIVWTPGSSLSDSTVFDPVAFPEQTTTYIATVTDEFGCTAVDSVTVEVNPYINIIYTGSQYVCKGQCNGQLKAFADNGNTPMQYLWSTGDTTDVINNLCAGTYSVTVTDTVGCSNYTSIQILNLPDIEITIEELINVTDSTNGAIDVTIDNHERAYGLEWVGMSGTSFFSTEEDIDSLGAGCYQLVVWDSLLNCSVDTTICIEDITNGMIDLSNNKIVKLYPNPVFDMVFIDATGIDIHTIEIFDISGKIRYENSGIIDRIDISSFENGVYFVKIKAAKGIYYKKILVSK